MSDLIDKKDKGEFERIRVIASPNDNDCQIIYNLYKKYIDKNAPAPTYGCRECNTSIVYYWRTVVNYYWQRKDLF